jgi:hypothetical protein
MNQEPGVLQKGSKTTLSRVTPCTQEFCLSGSKSSEATSFPDWHNQHLYIIVCNYIWTALGRWGIVYCYIIVPSVLISAKKRSNTKIDVLGLSSWYPSLSVESAEEMMIEQDTHFPPSPTSIPIDSGVKTCLYHPAFNSCAEQQSKDDKKKESHDQLIPRRISLWQFKTASQL